MFRIALSLLFAAVLGLGVIGCERKDRDEYKPSGTTGTETDRGAERRQNRDMSTPRERDMSTTPREPDTSTPPSRSNTGSETNQ